MSLDVPESTKRARANEANPHDQLHRFCGFDRALTYLTQYMLLLEPQTAKALISLQPRFARFCELFQSSAISFVEISQGVALG